MFTGLVEGKGIIKKILPKGAGFLLEIEAEFSLEDTKVGDSIAVDGICLTAIAVKQKIFAAEVSPETIARTTLKYKKPGDLVNLERALKLGDPLGGHLVSGHVDGTGKIVKILPLEGYHLFEIEVPQELSQKEFLPFFDTVLSLHPLWVRKGICLEESKHMSDY